MFTHLSEELLYFIWQYQLFDKNNLAVEGETLQILKQGIRNNDSGPDFFDGRIKIGNTIWAGNVEIHVRSSDWYKHRHQQDSAFSNVILHVVFIHDLKEEIINLPVLELKDRVSSFLLIKYEQLRTNRDWIPCSDKLNTVNEFHKYSWVQRMVIERLQQKTLRILQELKENNYDWQETFYRQLARNFGFKVNSFGFEQLARSIPQKVLAVNKDHPQRVEALLFGQAGLLEQEFMDDYPLTLKKEYVFQQKKHDLKPIDPVVWKFMRMRPVNFPTIRLSQFANLVSISSHLFSKALEVKDIDAAREMFSVAASGYWNDHYTFEKTSPGNTKSLGKTGVNNILINTVIPFIFAYGTEKNLQHYRERSLKLLEQLQPENNSILNKWLELGMENKNASQSQGLLYLKNEFCDKKQCIHCGIGMKILSAGN
jgi:hypothetical protein